MYNAVFESSDGRVYVFGADGNNVFEMDVGSGITVNIGSSQGFSQIGETVEKQSVKGRNITVKGVVFGDVPNGKTALRKAIPPFASGKLVFEKRYYTYVFVKKAPSFSAARNDGRFSLQFFAPFPFFYDVNETVKTIGSIIPSFSFPVNYSSPHIFGKTVNEKQVNAFNGGDVKVPFRAKITSKESSKNVTLTNLETLSFLKINAQINRGDVVYLYRDYSGILHVEKTSDQNTEDILYLVDEDSTLFDLGVGNNYLYADAEEGADDLDVTFFYNTAVGAVYEN